MRMKYMAGGKVAFNSFRKIHRLLLSRQMPTEQWLLVINLRLRMHISMYGMPEITKIAWIGLASI